ncbi:MAG: hypothetical protein E4H20_06620 [Spirochaetales bacterium]|nr:MAG: hypothetical protein E4H20_06620 [Spirochaetales bacterium]
MSRAFVGDEANESAADEAPEIKIPIPPGSRNYLTPEGAADLAEELTRLETVERPHVSAKIDRAVKGASDTDALSSLRRILARTDRRIEYLSRMAALADTIEPPEEGYKRVSFGATVTVREASGTERSYRIVGVDEADPALGRLGWISPIAKALMSKEVGDHTQAHLPESVLDLEILSIE